MKRLITISISVVILLGALMHARLVHADTGPKPSMDFQFSFESGVTESTIVSGILFQCSESDCSDAAPLEELGLQGLYCEPISCRAIGYGFAPYSMLEIDFSDGVTRRSNIFEQAGFESYYTVHVRQDNLFVEPRNSPAAIPTWAMVLIACTCGLAVLGLVAGLVVYLRRRARQ
jgi:hypothetical protein